VKGKGGKEGKVGREEKIKVRRGRKGSQPPIHIPGYATR